MRTVLRIDAWPPDTDDDGRPTDRRQAFNDMIKDFIYSLERQYADWGLQVQIVVGYDDGVGAARHLLREQWVALP